MFSLHRAEHGFHQFSSLHIPATEFFRAFFSPTVQPVRSRSASHPADTAPSGSRDTSIWKYCSFWTLDQTIFSWHAIRWFVYLHCIVMVSTFCTQRIWKKRRWSCVCVAACRRNKKPLKKEREKTKKRKPELDDLLKYDCAAVLKLMLVELFFHYKTTYRYEL